jgi:hypothetical protein
MVNKMIILINLYIHTLQLPQQNMIPLLLRIFNTLTILLNDLQLTTLLFKSTLQLLLIFDMSARLHMLLNKVLSQLTATTNLLQTTHNSLIVSSEFIISLKQFGLLSFRQLSIPLQHLNLIKNLISILNAITYLLTLELKLLNF